MRSYIESTIPSYVVARPARDLLQAARQQLTRDWWDLQREQHELFTSQVVLDEIAFGEKAMAQLRLETLQAVPLLQVTDEVKELARKVLTSGLLPVTSDRDATHIALASAYEMEILLRLLQNSRNRRWNDDFLPLLHRMEERDGERRRVFIGISPLLGPLPTPASRGEEEIARVLQEPLLSWNCRHIANAAIQTRLRRLVEAAGFTLPVICTPEELMESDNEQND